MTDEIPGLVIRSDYLEALDDAHDRQGRKIPHRLAFTRLMARWTVRDWRPIPGEYWTVDLNGDGYSEAHIACPCGQTPRVEALAPAVECDGEGCNRFYYFGADAVLVAYGGEDGTRPDA